jgi:hypothetical protein
MEWLIWMMSFITIIALSGIVVGHFDGRRKHKLEMKKEERKLIEARTNEIEAQNKRAELEYRQAQRELDQFDRRVGGAQPPAVQPAPPPDAP